MEISRSAAIELLDKDWIAEPFYSNQSVAVAFDMLLLLLLLLNSSSTHMNLS